MEGESENEAISSASLLNILTIWIIASSPRLLSEMPYSLCDSEATIANDNFTSIKSKGVVYEEQHAQVHENVVVMRNNCWNLKQQPTYREGLLLLMLKEGSIFKKFLVFILNLMIAEVI